MKSFRIKGANTSLVALATLSTAAAALAVWCVVVAAAGFRRILRPRMALEAAARCRTALAALRGPVCLPATAADGVPTPAHANVAGVVLLRARCAIPPDAIRVVREGVDYIAVDFALQPSDADLLRDTQSLLAAHRRLLAVAGAAVGHHEYGPLACDAHDALVAAAACLCQRAAVAARDAASRHDSDGNQTAHSRGPRATAPRMVAGARAIARLRPPCRDAHLLSTDLLRGAVRAAAEVSASAPRPSVAVMWQACRVLLRLVPAGVLWGIIAVKVASHVIPPTVHDADDEAALSTEARRMVLSVANEVLLAADVLTDQVATSRLQRAAEGRAYLEHVECPTADWAALHGASFAAIGAVNSVKDLAWRVVARARVLPAWLQRPVGVAVVLVALRASRWAGAAVGSAVFQVRQLWADFGPPPAATGDIVDDALRLRALCGGGGACAEGLVAELLATTAAPGAVPHGGAYWARLSGGPPSLGLLLLHDAAAERPCPEACHIRPGLGRMARAVGPDWLLSTACVPDAGLWVVRACNRVAQAAWGRPPFESSLRGLATRQVLRDVLRVVVDDQRRAARLRAVRAKSAAVCAPHASLQWPPALAQLRADRTTTPVTVSHGVPSIDPQGPPDDLRRLRSCAALRTIAPAVAAVTAAAIVAPDAAEGSLWPASLNVHRHVLPLLEQAVAQWSAVAATADDLRHQAPSQHIVAAEDDADAVADSLRVAALVADETLSPDMSSAIACHGEYQDQPPPEHGVRWAALCALCPLHVTSALREGPDALLARVHQWRTLSITLEHVSFAYGHVPVLDDVCLAIPAGRSLGLVGRSGAGKSTVLALVSGLLVPTAGTVWINGVDSRRLHRGPAARAFRRRLASFGLCDDVPDASVADSVLLGDPCLAFAPDALRTADGAVHAALWRADVDAVVVPRGGPAAVQTGSLSGGEAQRVGLARAALRLPHTHTNTSHPHQLPTDGSGPPLLVLLDEPTSALDAATEARVLGRLCASLSGEDSRAAADLPPMMGPMLLRTSHRPANLLRGSDSGNKGTDLIAVLDGGRVVQFGPAAAVAAETDGPFYKMLHVNSGTILV